LNKTEKICLTGLSKEYKDSKTVPSLTVFDELTLSVAKRKVSCIMGPSGCGKTTLLNIISRLTKPDRGEFIGFEDITISYLFQEPRLLPWKTVSQNIEFVIKDIFPRKERIEKINRFLEMMELSDFRDYYPNKLSGGMKQRVGMARAFIYPSDLLLMDEPFKGLDIQLKISLLNAFSFLWQSDLRTVIFVTHDPDEALFLGDEIHVFSALPAKLNKTIHVDIPYEERRYGEGKLKELREVLHSGLGFGLE